MSALVPLMTSTGPLLDRASAGVRALMNAVSRREGEYFEEGHFSAAQVKKELQDTNAEAKVRALKRLLAAHASGLDVSGLLPEVVKAIAVPSLELKRLVYLFLILHAETSRDVALLSINSFQKDLADRNQIIRATALKALASIRLLEVVQLLMAALRRAAADSSPFVRRTAAQCVVKVFMLDPDQFQELQKIVLTLLKDVEISVVGAAIVAFRELCLRHGAADCLRYQAAQLSPQQQRQQDAYLQRYLDEQQHKQQGPQCRQRSASAFGKKGDRDASTDTPRHGKEPETGKRQVEEEQQNAELPWRTDAKTQGRPNGQQEGGGDNDGGRAAAATGTVDATAANSEVRCHPGDAGHLKSAAAATKLRKLKAQACALALLHQHYRRLQESLLQLEPFAQVVAVDLFLRYARLFFAEPATAIRRKQQEQQRAQDARQQHEPQRGNPYGGERRVAQGRGLSPSRSSTIRNAGGGGDVAVDGALTYEKIVEESSANPLPADLRMFFWNLGQLLYSESVAVVASVAAAFYHLLPTTAWKPLVHPLLRCIYTSSVEFQEPLLHVTAALAAAAPSLFLPHFRCFFLAYNDPACVKQGKLLVLRRLLFSPRFVSAAAAGGDAATLPPLLLHELCTYIRWPGDPLLLSTCFSFLVNIALRFPSAQSACMQIFVQLLDTPASCSLASEAILGLQVLLRQQQEQQQQRPQQEGGSVAAASAVDGSDITEWTEKKVNFRGAVIKNKQPGGRQQLGWLVLQLAMHLSRVVQGAAARASIVWIVGEYQREVGWVAADVFRQLASSFKSEPGEVKLQILLLGLKVWALHWDNKQQLKEQQEQRRPLSAAREGREACVTGAAETVPAVPSAGCGTETTFQRDKGSSDESSLMRNGVLPAAATATTGATEGRRQQQQHQETQQLHAGVEYAQQREGGTAGAARQQEKQRQENEEQAHLLPQPTPEESVAAFPRLDRMLKYVCEAASFDISYDVRDVARLYFAMSRLALASEGDPSYHSHVRSSHRDSSPASRGNTSSTRSNDRCSSTPCSTIYNDTGKDNTDKSSNIHYVNDSGSLRENGDAATAVGDKEGDTLLVLEGLAGCGGQMFKNASPEALADMSCFARKYLRTLVKGHPRGQERKTQLQRSLKIQHPGGTTIRTPAAAGAVPSDGGKMCGSTYDLASEREKRGDWDSTMLLRESPCTTSSSASATEVRPSSCFEEEQEAREDSAGQSCGLLLGSLSELLGERMRGYIDLPPFAATNSPDELRKVEQTAALPELAQCLMRGSAVAAARGERNNVPSSHFYMDIQEVKAISSDDIVVKRSAAALMGRDANAKADFTPLDLDSFYADDTQSNGVAGATPPVVQNVRDAPATASFPTALTPTGAAFFPGAANSFPSSLECNSFLGSASNTVSETLGRGQSGEQQQSLWDMFGEAPQLHNERSVQQMQQNTEGESVAQYDGKAVTDLLSVDQVLVAASGSPTAGQVRDRGGGVAVAGEDEESD